MERYLEVYVRLGTPLFCPQNKNNNKGAGADSGTVSANADSVFKMVSSNI
jgi:hypothetical protein